MTKPLDETATQVLDVLAALRTAHADRDAAGIIAPYLPDAVRYTLAPPLQQQPGTEYGDTAGLERWLATFDGPVLLEHLDPQVVAAGDLAYVHTLTKMSATPAGSDRSFAFWYRSTFGLRRVDGAWRIAHVHESTPFHMDGSFRAATDLTPEI